MHKRLMSIASLGGLLILSGTLQAADFSGKYKSPTLSVEITPDHDAYGGSIKLNDQTFPMKAHAEAGGLTGTFTSGGTDFSFTATLAGDTLNLSTGGANYTLKKDAPVNPLAAAAPANPLAVAAKASGDLPAGYTLVTKTDSGRSMTTQKPSATSVMAAMKATFPELEKFFGARPTILGAYENVKDHKSATATFAVPTKGLKGVVSCKLTDAGATVGVIYCNADASPAEWAKLTAGSSDAGADAPPAAAIPTLVSYDFPDGTGSIGLPEGWTTDAQSCMTGVHIKGPADQVINIGFCVPVQTPDSQMVQMQRQLIASARQMGMQDPPPLKICIAPFTAPAEAMTNLVPQFSKFSEESGSFAIELDNLKTLPGEVKASLPGGKAARVSYGVTHIQDGEKKHFLGFAQIEDSPVGNGAWMFYMTEIAAPDKSFTADTPTMLAIINSLKPNNQVIAQRTHDNIDASNRRFAEMQQAHKEQMAGYDRQNKAWEQRQLQTSRSNADFDEVIRGQRTVLDTQTGDKSSVDLGNVDGIVNKLNESDPGHYQQIPLRDEMYPEQGH